MSDKKCRLIKECSFLKWKWFQLLLLQIHSLYLCQTVNFLAEPFRGCKRAPTRLVSFTLSIISIYFFSVESRLNVFENVSHKVICRSFCIVWAEMSLFHIKRLKIRDGFVEEEGLKSVCHCRICRETTTSRCSLF